MMFGDDRVLFAEIFRGAYIALQHHKKMLCRLALADDDFAGGESERLASLDTRTIVIGQVRKERQPSERIERRCGVRSHTRSRYWWINSMAIEPSPTAEATRLIEPWRTSPAAKMPGTFVSSK